MISDPPEFKQGADIRWSRTYHAQGFLQDVKEGDWTA